MTIEVCTTEMIRKKKSSKIVIRDCPFSIQSLEFVYQQWEISPGTPLLHLYWRRPPSHME